MLDVLLKLLGFGGGASVANHAAGVVNYGILAIAGPWLWLHRDEAIHFEMSLGALALIVGVAFMLIEVARRSAPGASG